MMPAMTYVKYSFLFMVEKLAYPTFVAERKNYVSYRSYTRKQKLYFL